MHTTLKSSSELCMRLCFVTECYFCHSEEELGKLTEQES